jgi:N-acetylmuramoyl-L-alanine amidase
VLLVHGLRREVLPTAREGQELLQLDLVLSGLGVATATDEAEGTLTLRSPSHEVRLYDRKSLAAVDGDLRLLSAPARLENGRWLVPVEGLPKLLEPLLAQPVSWHPAQRVLVIGAARVPKISVRTSITGRVARVIFEASQTVAFQARQEPSRVVVLVPGDLIQVDLPDQRLTGGIVESVEYLGGQENRFAINLGPRFQGVRAYQHDDPPRLVIEMTAAGSSAADATATPTPTPPPAAAAPEGGVRTVVIDPGHGGAEVGAAGPDGTLEKDVTLAIAKKLSAILTNELGLQVFLTRYGDQDVDLDQRTAIANNYKADLFISIHANASRSREAGGTEVYFLSYQASDDDSRRVALAEGASLPGQAPGGSDLAFILWDMAQAEFLEESSALASRLEEELAAMTGSQERGVKQAPFRVLVGAAMPAALIEVAFITNPEEEKLLVSSAYQSRVARALARGVARYRSERDRRAGALTAPDRPGF